MAYVFTFWTFYVLYKEYKIITNKRLQFLAAENRRPDQFTVSWNRMPSFTFLLHIQYQWPFSSLCIVKIVQPPLQLDCGLDF